MTAHRTKAYIYLLLVAGIWGAAGSVIKFTLKGLDPVSFLAYRFLIASIFSVVYFLVTKYKFPKGTFLPSVLYGFLAFPVALGLLFLGLSKTTVLDTTLIGLISPLLLIFGGAIIFRDHVTRREKLGILIVLLGSLFSTLFPVFNGISKSNLSGNALIYMFLIADASSSLLAKSLSRKNVDSLALVNLGLIVATLTTLPYAIFTKGFSELLTQITTLNLSFHLGVWYMALLSGTLAYLLYVDAQKSIEVSEAAIFRYLQPLFGVPLAIFWLGEKFTPHFIFGAAVVTIGIIIAEKKGGKK